MAAELDAIMEEELETLRKRGRFRTCVTTSGRRRSHATVAGRHFVSFCSNDYLGLADAPSLKTAAERAMASDGFGAGASRLISGNHVQLPALEDRLAAWLGCGAALVFPTGYQANMGLITALAGREDLVVSDALNHASLIDGCRLSGAQVAIYAHADPGAAEQTILAAKSRHPSSFRRVFIVTESVFSMDGDVAPLRALDDVCRRQQAHLLVDEAHALGALGPGGKGLCAAESVEPAARVGTFGKAFGTFGGVVLGSRSLISYLVNRARTFIFTTAPPPALVAATHASLAQIAASDGEERRARLAERITQLEQGLQLPSQGTPIVPMVVGHDRDALHLASQLEDQGLLVRAIRPPTVPEGTSRLRLTLSAAHTAQDVEHLLTALARVPLTRALAAPALKSFT